MKWWQRTAAENTGIWYSLAVVLVIAAGILAVHLLEQAYP